MVKDIFTCVDIGNIEHAIETLFSISKFSTNLTNHIIVECTNDKAEHLQQLLMEFPFNNKFKVHSIDVKHAISQKCIDNAQTHCANFYMTYARCFSPQIFHDIDAALYIDYDILALKSIDALLGIDLKKSYCACCLDMSMIEFGKDELQKIGSQLYFNGGVMLFNFAAIRQMGIDDKIRKFLLNPPDWYWSDGKDYGEQTLMNLMFKDNFIVIDPKYNVQAILLGYPCYSKIYRMFGHSSEHDLVSSCVLAHMQGAKPWNSNWRTWQSFQLPLKDFMYTAYCDNKSQLQQYGIYEALEGWKK